MSTQARRIEVGRVGDSVLRTDGVPKVTGEFAYSSDLYAAGMLWGHTLRSPHVHALIADIDISEALTMPGVHAVLTHDDVPGAKTYGLEFRDQPVLAIDRVRYYGEPVALVAAEHPEEARRAAEEGGGGEEARAPACATRAGGSPSLPQSIGKRLGARRRRCGSSTSRSRRLWTPSARPTRT